MYHNRSLDNRHKHSQSTPGHGRGFKKVAAGNGGKQNQIDIPTIQPTLALDTANLAVPGRPASTGPSSSSTPALHSSATTEPSSTDMPKSMRTEERHPFRRTQSSGAPNTPSVETNLTSNGDVNRAPTANMSTPSGPASDLRRRTSFPPQSVVNGKTNEPQRPNGVPQRVPSQNQMTDPQNKPNSPALNGNDKFQGSTSASPVPQSAPGVNQAVDRQQTGKNISNVLRTTIESIQAAPFLRFQIEEVQRRSDDVDVGRYPKQLQELANQAKMLKAQEMEAKAKSTAFGDVFGQQLMEILRTCVASTVQAAVTRPQDVTQADLDLVVSEQSTWRKLFEQAQQKEIGAKLEEADQKFRSLVDQVEAVKIEQKTVGKLEDDLKEYITNRLGESNYACSIDAHDIRTSIGDLAKDCHVTKAIVEEAQRKAAAKEAEQETDLDAALIKQMQERMDKFDTVTKDLKEKLKSEASERQTLQTKLDAEVSARQDLNAKYSQLLDKDLRREKEVAKLREDYKALKVDQSSVEAQPPTELFDKVNVLEAKYLALQAVQAASSDIPAEVPESALTRLEGGLSQLEAGLKQIESNKDNLRRVAVWLDKYSQFDETALAIDKSLQDGMPDLDRLAAILDEVTSEMVEDKARFAQVQSATQGVTAAIAVLQTARKELKGRWGDDDEEEKDDDDEDDDLPVLRRRKAPAPKSPVESATTSPLQGLEKNIQTLTSEVARVAELLSASNPSQSVQDALMKHGKGLVDLQESIKEFSSKSELQAMQDLLKASEDSHSSRLDKIEFEMIGLGGSIAGINGLITEQRMTAKKLQEAQSTVNITSTHNAVRSPDLVQYQSPFQVASPVQSPNQNSIQAHLQSQLLQTQTKLQKMDTSTQTRIQQLNDQIGVLQAQARAQAQVQAQLQAQTQGQGQGQAQAANVQSLQQSLYVLQRQVNALQQSHQNLTTQQIFRAVNEEVVSLFGTRLDKVEATSSALMVQYGTRQSAEAQKQEIEAACKPLRTSIEAMQATIESLKETSTSATATGQPTGNEEATKLGDRIDAFEHSVAVMKNDFTLAINTTAQRLTDLKAEFPSKLTAQNDEVKKVRDSLAVLKSNLDVFRSDFTEAIKDTALQSDLASLKSELELELETKLSAQRKSLKDTALQSDLGGLKADLEARLSALQSNLNSASTKHDLEITTSNETIAKHVELYKAVVATKSTMSERLDDLDKQLAQMKTASAPDTPSKREAKQTKALEKFRQEIQVEVDSKGQLLAEQLNANTTAITKKWNEKILKEVNTKNLPLHTAIAELDGMPDQMKAFKKSLAELEDAQNKTSSELNDMQEAHSKADVNTRDMESQLSSRLTERWELIKTSCENDLTEKIAKSEKSLKLIIDTSSSSLMDSHREIKASVTHLEEAQGKLETQLGEIKNVTQATYDKVEMDNIVAGLRQDLTNETFQVRQDIKKDTLSIIEDRLRKEIVTEIDRLLNDPANILNEVQQKISEGQFELNEVVSNARNLHDETAALYRKLRDALKSYGTKDKAKKDIRSLKICMEGMRKDLNQQLVKKIRSFIVMPEEDGTMELDKKEAIPDSPTEIPSAINGKIFGSVAASTPGSPRATPSILPRPIQDRPKHIQTTYEIPLGKRSNAASQSGHSRVSSGAKLEPIQIFESDDEDQEVAPAKPLSTPIIGKTKHKSKLKTVKHNDGFDVPDSEEDELVRPSVDKLHLSTHSREPSSSSRPMTAVSTSSTASKRKATDGEQRAVSSKMQRTTSQGDRKPGLLGAPAGRNSGGLIKQSPPAAKASQSKKSGLSKKG